MTMGTEDSRWTPAQLQSLWNQMETTIHPFTHVLCLTGDLFRAMDNVAKRFIAEQFMHHVTESVMFCKDGTGNDRYFLGAPRHFVSGSGMIFGTSDSVPIWVLRPEARRQNAEICPPCLPRKPVKIPRPPNAYILYRKERHNAVKEANPGITNNEISQILGRAWNLETRDVRQKYKEMSENMKYALLAKHPDYQYRPRKPSEKKKRRLRKAPTSAMPTTAGSPSSEDTVINESASAAEITE